MTGSGEPLLARARRVARDLRHAPDRLLHRWRRSLALERLRRQGPPGAVLVVCHGNICRSPYAAAVLAAALPETLRQRTRIRSAGFIGAGRPAPPTALAVASRLGFDLSGHRSSPITSTAVDSSRLVVVMDADQQREIVRRYGRSPDEILVLGDLDPEPIDTRTIRDPVEQSAAVFAESYARIDRCISQLVKAVSGRTSRPLQRH